MAIPDIIEVKDVMGGKMSINLKELNTVSIIPMVGGHLIIKDLNSDDYLPVMSCKAKPFRCFEFAEYHIHAVSKHGENDDSEVFLCGEHLDEFVELVRQGIPFNTKYCQ